MQQKLHERLTHLDELSFLLLAKSFHGDSDGFPALSPALQLPCCSHVCSVPAAPASKLVESSYQRAKWLSSRIQPSSSDDIAEEALEEIGGGFTMQLLMGDPPQPTDLLFDTGSDLIWVRCSRDQSTSFFNETSSSTYNDLTCTDPRCAYVSSSECTSSCEYSYEYGGGSETQGRFSTETVWLRMLNGTLRRFPGILIGCGDENEGFEGLEGIAGFGRGRISLISQLQHSVDNRFSYCLSSATNSSPLFYGSEAVIQDSHVQSTALLSPTSDYSYYFVSVIGLSIGGSRMVIPQGAFENTGGTILDSGTTLTFLPNSVYNRLRHSFSNRIHLPTVDGSSWGFDLCYDVSSAPDYTFPSLVLEFQNARMVPAQENYFFAPNNDSTVCLAIGSSDGLGVNIIGNLMQQGFHILFDNAASRLSFAPAECDQL